MKKAKLPGLPRVATGNAALDRWILAVSEYIEVREGGRGSPLEQVVTKGDLKDVDLSGLVTRAGLSDAIRNTQTFSELLSRVSTTSSGSDSALVRLTADVAISEQRVVNSLRAHAELITQVRAGLAGVTSIAEATDDLVTGLSAKYTVKVNAGGAVAGFGLAAEENLAGVGTSIFEVQADKFKVTMPGLSSASPFGVDASGVYINGSLRINAGGGLLQDSTSGAPGQGQVKGVSFLRSVSAPTTPTGGSFASPTATSWSDGIPADNNQPLWMTTRLFTSDGLTPQQSVWTTPAKVGTPSTGTRSVFSVDGSTAWHTTPATNDYYMATQTSTDNGATWGASTGSVKIKGEIGQASTTPGPTGTRGTIITKIATAFTAAAGAAQVAVIANASGSTPNTPIKGDIVSWTNGVSSGAMECTTAGNPGTWAAVAAYIDGSLIVTGTMSADKISAGTISSSYIDTDKSLKVGGASWSSGAGIAAGTFNASNLASFGVVASSNLLSAIQGSYSGTTTGRCGVAAISNSSGYYGAIIQNNAANGKALSVVGVMDLTGVTTGTPPITLPASSSVCTNLNANYLQGNLASAFATAGHGHGGNITAAGAVTYAATAGSATTAASCSGNTAGSSSSCTGYSSTAGTANNALALNGSAASAYLMNGGSTSGNPGTAFTNTLYISAGGITVRVPCFYP